MRSFAVAVVLAITFVILASCSSEDEASAGLTTSGERGSFEDDAARPPAMEASDAREERHGDGEGDAVVTETVMGCTSFVDRSLPDASRALTWDFTFPITEERCLGIRAGQSIRFTDGAGQVARFDIHSVQASGGDQPNPIGGLLDLQTGEVTFPAPGTFGFFCVDHRSMRGAVRAVP